MKTVLHAQPYDTSATGFYFSSFEEYQQKSESLKNAYGYPVEEFEIQFIDGDDCELFTVCGISQCDIEMWFDTIELLDDNEKVALFYLLDNGNYRGFETYLEKMDEVEIHKGTLLEAAENLFNDCYMTKELEHIRNYIDYEKFANDLELGGDMREFTFEGETYTCTNANSI